ncbi:MAG TPA: ABC transporter permease [Dehalococcoidia bacterium]|jgi:peptide/nickel transport system permease protein|nr:ABC transporter permease [Dehalococcoidia bacterium]
MQTPNAQAVRAAAGLAAMDRPHLGRRAVRLARQYPLGAFGLLVLLLFIILGVFGPALAPYNPRALNTGRPLALPSARHWFGTNTLGQDIFSRVLAGARISLEISGAAVLIGGTVGSFLGILAGYFGRWIDYLLQRSSEAFYSFPSLILYFLLIAAFGQGVLTIIAAIGVASVFSSNRVLRGATIAERGRAYVEAARAVGCPERRIFLRHVVPNVLPLAIVLMSGGLGGAVIAEATLAFLGLGVPPGTPSWGIDMSGNNLSVARLGYWQVILFPGMAISLIVLGANLLGDALRDILDPRMRH